VIKVDKTLEKVFNYLIEQCQTNDHAACHLVNELRKYIEKEGG
jgi:hypothetical protein